MKKLINHSFIFIFSILAVQPGTAHALAEPSHHELFVSLNPAKNASAEIRDTITLYPDKSTGDVLSFALHADYKIKGVGIMEGSIGKMNIAGPREEHSGVSVRKVDIQKPPGQDWPKRLKLMFSYAGPIHDPMRSSPDGEPRAENEGVLLSGISFFYPRVITGENETELMTFKMTVDSPADWRVVSQGEKQSDLIKENRRATVWLSGDPMEEIFLIADRFQEYAEPHGELTIYAFLLEKDEALATRYIKTAKSYIDFYEKLLGPYPYKKFALVENSRQTGWGMPSFTLMGSRIIRFPFILHTSYPHEILHNWWGNGVYTDPHSGNWSEGLTAYLSDHLLMELQGKGGQYRFQELMKYMNYVNESNDFPLIKFKSRDSMASQAIGYGKTLMMFHMLRTELGDNDFLKALRHFYKNNLFRFAGFDDLKASCEFVSGKKLDAFFRQWTERTGGPELELSSASVTPAGDQYELKLEVRQKQSEGKPFALNLPVAVWLKGADQPRMDHLDITKKRQTFTLTFPGEPTAALIDPYTAVFRKLNIDEVPPSIGQTFGAEESGRILPGGEESPDLHRAYQQMAQSLGGNTGIVEDNSSAPLSRGSLWMFGRNNTFAKKLLIPPLARYGIKIEARGITIAGETFPWADHSFAFTVRRPGERKNSVTWVVVGSKEAVPGLLRKLPHYGKYGYLVFKGTAPENQLKGIWPVQRTGRLHTFEKGEYPLLAEPPLVDFKPRNN